MLHCKISQKLQTLPTDVHGFGDVTTSITPCDIQLVDANTGKTAKRINTNTICSGITSFIFHNIN
jgi:hypothetical protein